jgi:hypothetical protein
MEIPTLDWSGATVTDGVLTVGIAGNRPKGWKSTFERTAKLLNAGRWHSIELKRGTVRVGDVHEGSEDTLHHFLESVMQQANAPLVAEQASQDSDAGDDTDGDGDADSRMTERFRGSQPT